MFNLLSTMTLQLVLDQLRLGPMLSLSFSPVNAKWMKYTGLSQEAGCSKDCYQLEGKGFSILQTFLKMR